MFAGLLSNCLKIIIFLKYSPENAYYWDNLSSKNVSFSVENSFFHHKIFFSISLAVFTLKKIFSGTRFYIKRCLSSLKHILKIKNSKSMITHNLQLCRRHSLIRFSNKKKHDHFVWTAR